MTQTNIPHARRQFIKSVVVNAYEHFNSPKLPIEIKALARSFSHIRLISYKKYMRDIGVLYEVLTSIAKDSYTDYYADMEMYYIYYNDIDRNIVTSNRYRWNIAHELGHVLLGHLRDNEKTRLTRPALPDNEYKYLEEEADYFAQLILVPHSPLWGFNIQSSNHLKILCKISGPASRKRMYEYNAWKYNGQPMDDYDNRILDYYQPYVYKKKCKTCGVGLIQRYGKHCPICGSKNTLQWGDGDMKKYPLLETHENGKLVECPICHNGETEIDGDYCQICGRNIVNRCSYFQCTNNNILPSNARYCPICGNNSTFFNADFLKAWDYQEPLLPDIPDGIDEELPFDATSSASDKSDDSSNNDLIGITDIFGEIDEELPFN